MHTQDASALFVFLAIFLQHGACVVRIMVICVGHRRVYVCSAWIPSGSARVYTVVVVVTRCCGPPHVAMHPTHNKSRRQDSAMLPIHHILSLVPQGDKNREGSGVRSVVKPPINYSASPAPYFVWKPRFAKVIKNKHTHIRPAYNSARAESNSDRRSRAWRGRRPREAPSAPRSRRLVCLR
mgnify:FL=1